MITLQFEGVGTRQYFVSLRDEADENVGEGEGMMAERVESVAGSTKVQSNDRPQFDFEVTSGNASLERAAIETQNDFEAIDADDTGQRSVFEINGEESSQSTDTDRNFEYEFDPVLEFAENDGEISVKYNRLDTQIENLEFVNQDADADLVIAFEFGDGSVKEFYFEGDEK